MKRGFLEKIDIAEIDVHRCGLQILIRDGNGSELVVGSSPCNPENRNVRLGGVWRVGRISGKIWLRLVRHFPPGQIWTSDSLARCAQGIKSKASFVRNKPKIQSIDSRENKKSITSPRNPSPCLASASSAPPSPDWTKPPNPRSSPPVPPPTSPPTPTASSSSSAGVV